MPEKSPQLERVRGEHSPEQRIEVYEGVEGARKAIEKMIGAGQDYLHFIGYENKKWEKANTQWARENIVPKKVAAGIKSTGIYYPTDIIKKVWQPVSGTEMRDVSLLPQDKQLPLRFYIYGDSVLFIEEVDNDFRSIEVTDARIAQEMRSIFKNFLSNTKEPKETRTTGREVDLHLIRHGEAEAQTKEARLSPKGRLQAEIAALKLAADIWSQGGGLLKFYFSPTPRAQETSEIMNQTLRRIIGRSKDTSPIKLYEPRSRTPLEAPGVIGPLMKQGIPYEKTVEHWLSNPGVIKGKTPEDIYKRLQEVLRLGKKLADRLPPGEKIFQAAVTHEIPEAALLNQISGQTLNELGGGIQNCESIKVEQLGGSDNDGIVKFRDREIVLGSPKKDSKDEIDQK